MKSRGRSRRAANAPPEHAAATTGTGRPPALLLSGLEPFAVGGKRRCFVHPGDAGLCVKVPLDGDDRIGHAEQRQDVESYALMQKRGLAAALDRIPAIKGVVETDLGLGVVSRMCRDADGQISRNLAELIRTRSLTPGLADAIGELKVWLRDHRLLIRDTGPHNIVAMRLGADEWKLMIVEGWMHRRYHWLVRRNRFLANYWIDRQLRRFDERAEALTDAEQGPA